MREVSVNEAGLRIGEGHPGAKLTDYEIEQIRILREEEGMTYGQLAAKFEQSKGTIAKICRYERRGQTPSKWKTIEN